MASASKRITTNTVNKLIKSIESDYAEIKNDIADFMYNLGDRMTEQARQYLLESGYNMPTGDAINSLRVISTDSDGFHFSLICDSEHAQYLEYGTGLYASGNYPGRTSGEYSQKDSWVFKLDPEYEDVYGDSVMRDKNGNLFLKTYGLSPVAFLYRTKEDAKRWISEFVNSVNGGGLYD